MRAFWRLLQHSAAEQFSLDLLHQMVEPSLVEALMLEEVLIPSGAGVGDFVRLSAPNLVALVRRVLHIDGAPFAVSALGSPKEVPVVGALDTGDTTAEVFLVLQPASEVAVWFLAHRRGMPVKTIVLMPSSESLSPPIAHLRDAAGPIDFRFLDETMCFQDGHFVMAPFPRLRRATTSPGPFCNVTDPDGSRVISRPEYLATMNDAANMDLLIDATTTGDNGLYRASARWNGQQWQEPLAWNQAAVLIELARIRRPIKVSELTSVNVGNPAKLIERARRLVDVELTWRSWRSFKTLPGDVRRDKMYFFDPPEGLRFAFLYF